MHPIPIRIATKSHKWIFGEASLFRAPMGAYEPLLPSRTLCDFSWLKTSEIIFESEMVADCASLPVGRICDPPSDFRGRSQTCPTSHFINNGPRYLDVAS
jgi:hypothetical protein